MVYLIVDWDQQNLRYNIITYSHNYDDMVNQYLKCRKLFPTCQILIDLFELQSEELRIKYDLHRRELKDVLKQQ